MKTTLLYLLTSLFLFVGCQDSDTTIRIATKPMTEQFILGEMLAILIANNTSLHPVITKGIGGGTSNIHPAIVKGDFDLYPEYTGTGWLVVLKKIIYYHHSNFTTNWQKPIANSSIWSGSVLTALTIPIASP